MPSLRLLVLILLSLAFTVRAEEVPDWKAVDAHARAAPKEAAETVEKLAEYLKKGAKDERSKARAIFIWISENLSYDLDSVPKGRFEQRPAVVVQTQCTDCGGHARLFEALAAACGLKAVSITGQTRELFVDPLFASSTKVTASGVAYGPHVWNAVRIDGHWQLLDVTFANGRYSSNGKVEQRRPTNLEWFLVAPRVMICSHLPDEPRWQLLKRPLTQKQQEARPFLRPGAFRHNIELLDPDTPSLKIEDTVTLTVRAPRDVVVSARLFLGQTGLQDTFVFAQRDVKGADTLVRVAIPKQGIYLVRLFAQQRSALDSKWDLAAEVKVEASSGKGEDFRFPFPGSLFVEKGCHLDRPLDGTLTAGKKQEFTITVPGATAAGVRIGEKQLPLAHKDGVFSGEVLLAPGEVILAAEFPDRRGLYRSLVKYIAK
jgi:transglutaminase-like putative cysteine protease